MAMDIFKKINFKQPKYMLPLIIYIPLLATGYFIFDIFDTEVADIGNKNLQTTEYLNPELPDARVKGDGIGSKYESMLKSYGKIDDYSAVDNIDRNNEEESSGTGGHFPYSTVTGRTGSTVTTGSASPAAKRR